MARIMSKSALNLTSLQRTFCTELIKDPSNATKAYRAAAGPVKGARQSAHKLMNHPKMKEWITNHRIQLDKDAAYTLQRCHADHEQAKLASLTASEFLTVVQSQMRLHGLTQVTKSVNSSGYTTANLRSMSDAELVKLLGADRVARLAAFSTCA
jgi:phage terminase small subunit